LRIGINSLFLIPGEVGGTETYLREILLCMTNGALAPDDEIIVFTNLENDDYLRSLLSASQQVTFSPLRFRAANRTNRILREQLQLPGKARQAGVDVLWSPGYTAPLSSQCTQVVTIHDMQYKRFPADLTFAARIATDFLVQQACTRCDRIITGSRFSRTELLKFTSAKPDMIWDIPDGVSPTFAQCPDGFNALSVKKIVESERPYLLCVANTYVHKNVPLLIKAFGRLLSTIQHSLVLVGMPGLDEPEVIRTIEGITATDRVIRLSRLDHDDIRRLYHGAEAFVLPSLYEGFGLPVLEAMTAGVPVITTREGAIGEVGGDCVEYFDPTDEQRLASSICDLLKMSEQAKAIRISRAKERACEFSWENTARTTLQCLKADGHKQK
jgi:glycosyltransferase involved in cell wall biosynthesis